MSQEVSKTDTALDFSLSNNSIMIPETTPCPIAGDKSTTEASLPFVAFIIKKLARCMSFAHTLQNRHCMVYRLVFSHHSEVVSVLIKRM